MASRFLFIFLFLFPIRFPKELPATALSSDPLYYIDVSSRGAIIEATEETIHLLPQMAVLY